jgi:uncharacterized protein YbaR (Trm112 family)
LISRLPAVQGPARWKKDAQELVCKADRLAFPVKNDIPVMLEDEARALGPTRTRNLERLAFTVLIPARMRSTRLPGKMLADVAGKPLVAWAPSAPRRAAPTTW